MRDKPRQMSCQRWATIRCSRSALAAEAARGQKQAAAGGGQTHCTEDGSDDGPVPGQRDEAQGALATPARDVDGEGAAKQVVPSDVLVRAWRSFRIGRWGGVGGRAGRVICCGGGRTSCCRLCRGHDEGAQVAVRRDGFSEEAVGYRPVPPSWRARAMIASTTSVLARAYSFMSDQSRPERFRLADS
jgi:hypothetical protein